MAARQLYLIRLGEICLKGENRSFFEKKLRTNIKYKLKGLHPAFRIQKGRFFLEVDDIEGSEARTEAALSTTSGLVAFSKTLKTDKDIEAIKEAVIALTGPYFSKNPQSFKVNARRLTNRSRSPRMRSPVRPAVSSLTPFPSAVSMCIPLRSPSTSRSVTRHTSTPHRT